MVACSATPTWFIVYGWWHDSRWCYGSRCLMKKNRPVVLLRFGLWWYDDEQQWLMVTLCCYVVIDEDGS